MRRIAHRGREVHRHVAAVHTALPTRRRRHRATDPTRCSNPGRPIRWRDAVHAGRWRGRSASSSTFVSPLEEPRLRERWELDEALAPPVMKTFMAWFQEGIPGTGYWVLGTGYWVLVVIPRSVATRTLKRRRAPWRSRPVAALTADGSDGSHGTAGRQLHHVHSIFHGLPGVPSAPPTRCTIVQVAAHDPRSHRMLLHVGSVAGLGALVALGVRGLCCNRPHRGQPARPAC